MIYLANNDEDVNTIINMSKLKKTLLSPSMMCADFLHLEDELSVLKSEGVDMLHIDIMDGQYVPNFTLGTDLAKTMYNFSGITLDYHLMVEQVDDTIELFTEIPGSYVTFHPETSRHPVRTIQKIRDKGCKPGIAIDPAISIETIKHLLPLVDMVCVMTVNPGYAGQALIPFCLDKIEELKAWRTLHKADFLIEVDGNVSWENVPEMIRVGADVLVLGTSSVFNKNESRHYSYERLRKTINTSL